MTNKEDPSLAQSVRLRSSHWVKLRELMQFYGNRQWLEKAIDREYKKIFGAHRG